MNKLNQLFLAFLLVGIASTIHAQNVGIGTNTPHTSAKLHLVDANRGILIPQVSIGNVALAAPVTTPATGLLVWNSNAAVTGGNGQGFYYWDGTRWVQLGTGDHNTLDMAYDEGGAGLGRIITADAGTVEINGTGGLWVNANNPAQLSAIQVDNTNGTQSSSVELGYIDVSGGNTNVQGLRSITDITAATNLWDGGFGVYGVTRHPSNGTVALNGTVGSSNKAVGIGGGIGSRTSFTGSAQDIVAAVYGGTGLHNSSGGTVTGAKLYAGLFAGNGRTLGLWGENSTYMELVPRWQNQDYDAGVVGFYNSAANGGNNGASIGTADSYLSIEANVTDATVKHVTLQTRTNGNVGIGTATPSEKLHVAGGTRITSLSGVNNRLVQSNATGVLSNIADGTAGQVLTTDGVGGLTWQNSVAGSWDILGNAGTNPTNNFLGTTDNQDLVLRTNNVENVRVNTDGNVGIGTASNAARLYLNLPSSDVATNYGLYNYFDGADAGTVYAIRNHNYGSTNSTKYGIYNNVNSEGTGTHYGIYNLTYMNSASNATGYGSYNYLNSYGTGNHRASYNYLYHSGTAVSNNNFASYNLMNIATSSNTSTIHGEFTQVDYSAGIRYGEYKDMNTSTIATGTVYADYNLVDGSGNDLIYGVYADITNTGTGTHYGLYSNTPGGTNDYAAYFNAGNVVMNEIGGVYNVRMESDTRINMFYLDGLDNLVRIGNSTTGDWSNGNTVSGVVVDYVVDFDRGVGATGTAIGIGSVEYLLDLSSETSINNRFSPATDNIYDLGSATLRWDDVYATNGTIQTSDAREKTQIEPLKYGLAEIMKLRPVSYKWKRTHVGETLIPEDLKEVKLGLLAQEVQKTVPEVVQTHDWTVESEENPNKYIHKEMERLGMSYSELIPVLIKGMQEQQAQIEALENEVKALKGDK